LKLNKDVTEKVLFLFSSLTKDDVLIPVIGLPFFVGRIWTNKIDGGISSVADSRVTVTFAVQVSSSSVRSFTVVTYMSRITALLNASISTDFLVIEMHSLKSYFYC